MSRDAAVKAAAEALYPRQRSYQLTDTEVEALATAAVDAAAPHLLAAERQRIHDAIRVQIDHDTEGCTRECDSPYCWGCADCSEADAYAHAARIANPTTTEDDA